MATVTRTVDCSKFTKVGENILCVENDIFPGGYAIYTVNEVIFSGDELKTQLVFAGYLQIVKGHWEFGNGVGIDILGRVWTWGYNSDGEAGRGETGVITLGMVPGLQDIVQIASNGDTVGALDVAGNLYTWGYNRYGQVGNGSTDTAVTTPQLILTGVTSIVSISLGCGAMCGTDLYLWGYNGSGRCGNGTIVNVYTPYKALQNVYKACAMREVMTLAILTNRTLVICGSNYYLKLGGTLAVPYYAQKTFAPVQTGIGVSLQNVEFIFTDYTSSLGGVENIHAVLQDGSLYSCGKNRYGKLGLGNTAVRNYATKVNLPTKVVTVWGGLRDRTIIELDNGLCYAAGLNVSSTSIGILGCGDGITLQFSTYQQVLFPVGVTMSYSVEMSTVMGGTCAFGSDGIAYIWGTPFGNGAVTPSPTPMLINTQIITGVTSMDAYSVYTGEYPNNKIIKWEFNIGSLHAYRTYSYLEVLPEYMDLLWETPYSDLGSPGITKRSLYLNVILSGGGQLQVDYIFDNITRSTIVDCPEKPTVKRIPIRHRGRKFKLKFSNVDSSKVSIKNPVLYFEVELD